MIHVASQYDLSRNNTFGIPARAAAYGSPSNNEELGFLLNYASDRSMEPLIIGEGSNLLFRNDYDGLVIQPCMRGIELKDQSDSEVLVRAGAGENWDDFVEHCVAKDWWGAENLSLIPGTVGSAPVQNIGAYGVEVQSLVEHVEVFDRADGSIKYLSNSDCDFDYRSSIFKHAGKQRFIVTHVLFRLKKKGTFILNYGNVREEFGKAEKQTLEALRQTIIRIRMSKLPDVTEFGNAGSFFKNPVIPEAAYIMLKEKYVEVPSYPAPRGVKIPAAWLIDRCGLKGIREGRVGTWPGQPLVIVNYGGATGKEIFGFSEMIRGRVLETFGIDLEREVRVI